METFAIHKELEGNILRTEGIFRDITEKKNAEEKYRNIVELAPDGIITFNKKGVVTSVNSAFCKLTGFSGVELVGKHFTKLGTVQPKDMLNYIKFFSAILRGKQSNILNF